jgi:hypothetical protein
MQLPEPSPPIHRTVRFLPPKETDHPDNAVSCFGRQTIGVNPSQDCYSLPDPAQSICLLMSAD